LVLFCYKKIWFNRFRSSRSISRQHLFARSDTLHTMIFSASSIWHQHQHQHSIWFTIQEDLVNIEATACALSCAMLYVALLCLSRKTVDEVLYAVSSHARREYMCCICSRAGRMRKHRCPFSCSAWMYFVLVQYMVAVSVAVVISTSSHRCRPVAVVISTSDHRSVVSSLSLYRRHQTSILSLLHAEREHALGHRQMMTQMFRHGTFSGLAHQHQTCIRSVNVNVNVNRGFI